ncbi:unnamed protein product [Sphagnum balticum]
MQTAVHQLWPPPGDMRKTEMNILFFHDYARDPDEWKSAWTQRSHPDLCWPEKWLPADLGFNVRVLFVSYGPYRVAVVVDDLFKALIIRDEWDLCKNDQPLVLVGRGGFGVLVLDKFFLKATEELSTSPTEAGAFVRNVRGVTLYGDSEMYTKSYEIEKFFGGKLKHFERKLEDSKCGPFSHTLRHVVFITQGSMLINPAIYGKNLTRDVVGMDPCQWIKEDIREDWNHEVRWKPKNQQSRGYNLLLESCQMVHKFEAIRAIFEDLLQKLDNITTAFDISNYSASMFETEFTYLQHNGIEGAKILILQRMLETVGEDVEQHMVGKKSDDGEQLENERKLAILKFTVARFCENHEWHMVPEMGESYMQEKIKSVLNDVVDGIPPLSDDIMNEKMHRERERESMYHPDRQAFPRDGIDTVPIHFPSIREQSIMSVKQLQQLACNMGLGENLPQEDVQEHLMAHMAQVLHGGKLLVTANILEGKIQFLFGNGKSMAQIVGVGLDFATVSMTPENVVVVEGITELEWTRLWGGVFLGQSLFENSIFMESVVTSPPDHEKPQGSHVNALSKVAMFFMIKKFLQNLDVGNNQIVGGVATTMTEENQSDIGQVHAQRVNDPSTGILGFNFLESWDYFSSFPSERVLGSATRGSSRTGGSHVGGTDIPSKGGKDQGVVGSATGGSSGAGGSHVGGTDIPSKGGKEQGTDGGEDQGGDGGEDDGNGKGPGAKGNEIRQNNQPNVLVTVIPGCQYGRWERNSVQGSDVDPIPEQPEGMDIDPIPEQLEGSDIDLIPEQLEGSDIDPIPEQLAGSDIDPIPEQLAGSDIDPVDGQLAGSDIDPIPKQLEESFITPTLKFLFKKTEYIIGSDLSVTCCLKEGSSCKDLKRFGWFHDNISVSFQCMKPGAATPLPSELLGSRTVKDTMSEQTHTSPSQLEIEGKAGCSHLLSGEVSWTSASNVHGKEKVRVGVSNFIGDTRFRADCVYGGGETPMIAYNFKLCPEISTDKLPDSCDEENRKGSVCTVFPHFKADWTVTSEEVCEYELKVKRHACELVLVTEKPTWVEQLVEMIPVPLVGMIPVPLVGMIPVPSCTCNEMLQTYSVRLHINQRMSNIATLAEPGRPLCKNHPSNNLIGINKPPNRPAIGEASSRTQQHTL